MLFSLLKDANTAVVREHVVDILMLPRVKVVSSKPCCSEKMMRTEKNAEKKRIREKRDACICVSDF